MIHSHLQTFASFPFPKTYLKQRKLVPLNQVEPGFILYDFQDLFICHKSAIQEIDLRVAKWGFQYHITVTFIIGIIRRRRADVCQGQVLHL